MPKLKPYGVFISHAWDYNSEYDSLVKRLNKAKHFDWRNYSVPEHDPLHAKTDKQLEKELHDQIRPASVVVIVSGMYVNNRKWIQKEIDIALEMNKPIIGLKPLGAQRIPEEVNTIAPVISRNISQIIDAIRHPTKLKPAQQRPEDKGERSIDASTTDRRWNEDVTNSPDFSDLRDWIGDFIPNKINWPNKRIEPRRGVSG